MAGGAIIGALRIVLGIDTAQFETGAKKAQAQSDKLASKVTAAFDRTSKSASTLTAALGAIGGALALKELAGAAQRAFDYADSIQDLADRTGASTKTIQEFRYAAQLSGSSVETADEALGRFTKTMGLAQAGGDAQVKLFRDLGVTSGDFDVAFRQTLDGLAKLPTIQQRNAVALQLFGKSAATLTGLLGQGSAGFEMLAVRARELGIVLSDDVIRNAGGANDKLDTLKMILDAQFANTITQNADSIVALADGLTRLTSAVINFMSQNPREALALIGAMAGARAGPIGATVGAAAGYIAGDQLAKNAADQNMNLKFRVQKARESVQAYRAAKAAQKGAAGRGVTIRKAIGDGPQGLRSAAGEMRRQQGLLDQAQASAQGRASALAAVALPGAGNAERSSAASKAAAEQKRRQAEAARMAEKARRDEERFQDQLGRERADRLRATAELAVTQDDRVNAEQAMLDEDKRARLAEIARDRDLTEEQKKQLSSLVEETSVLRARLLHRRDQEELARQELEHQERVSGNAQDLLDAQAGLARTAADRRKIELKLLDLQFEQLDRAQQAIIDSATSTDQEKQDARDRQDVLDQLKEYARERTKRDTAGPLGKYLDSMPKNAAELNEAYQNVAVDGLRQLNDGLADAIMGTKSLADVFSDTAKSIIADLARIAIQQMIIKPLAARLFKATGGDDDGASSSSSGGLFDAFTRMIGKGSTPGIAGGVPGFASGGSFDIRGNRGIDRNVLSLNRRPIANVSYGEKLMIGRGGGAAGPAHVTIAVEEGALFRPVVRSEAGAVSASTVTAAGRGQALHARQSLA